MQTNRNERLCRFAAGIVMAVSLCSAAARADCTLSVGTLNFGTYDILNTAPLDSVATVTYSCEAVVSPTMSLSKGNAPNFSPRQMLQGTSALAYNLYLDAARTAVWGDGTAATSTFACSIGTSLTVSIFGRVFAGQNLAVGSYSDNILATITF